MLAPCRLIPAPPPRWIRAARRTRENMRAGSRPALTRRPPVRHKRASCACSLCASARIEAVVRARASVLVPRWRRTAPTAESRAAPIAHIQVCAAWPRHDCFGSSGCSGLAMPLARTHASRHTTRTTGSSRPCDRRPARDRVGDPRCCSRWGCNSGPERKPAYEAIVGAGRQPSLLSGISERQLPVDGAVRMPRKR